MKNFKFKRSLLLGVCLAVASILAGPAEAQWNGHFTNKSMDELSGMPGWGGAGNSCLRDNGIWGDCGGGTFNGGTVPNATTFQSATTTAGLNDSGGISTSNRILATLPTLDYSTLPAATRYHWMQFNLAPSADTSNIFESFNSFLYLSGPGKAVGELNNFHGYTQINSGGFYTAGEAFEMSMLNAGTVSTMTGFLSQPHNQSTGTIGTYIGANFNHQNDAGGTWTLYVAIQCNATSGTVEGNDYCFNNKDPNGQILSIGPMTLGGSGTTATTLLHINGVDSLQNSFPLVIKNSNLATTFAVGDDGTVLIGNEANVSITNGSSSTITTQINFNSAITNNNTAAGSIAAVNDYQCAAFAGTGTVPTLRNCIANKDPNALIGSLGPIHLGGLSSVPTGTLELISGGDTSAGTFPLLVKNSSATTSLAVNDAGGVSIGGILQVGTVGSVAGQLQFFNATSGVMKINPATGALGNAVFTLPNIGSVTDTFATLLSPQTFASVETFSNTLNVSGILQSNGVAGLASKTCTINTANAATGITLTISNGIITGTTTC